MHISQRRKNLLLAQSVFLLEGRKRPQRAMILTCWDVYGTSEEAGY